MTTVVVEEDVYAEVADWYVRLDGEHVLDADRSAFTAWLEESEPRRRAHADMAVSLALLTEAALQPTLFEAQLEPLVSQDTTNILVFAPRRWFLRAAVAAAAGLALIVGASFAMLGSNGPRATTVATPVGGTMTVKLNDGSTVYLNTDTRLTYSMGREKRSLLLERGEAYFEVAHDAVRPFVVTSGAHTITDIGTAFDVKLTDGVTTLIVAEGATRVGRASASLFTRSETRDVKAGMSARMAADGSVTVTLAQNVDAGGAWRTGRLIYRDQSIADIIADLDRYLDSKLVLTNPDRGGDLFTVVLQVDSEPAMLKRMAQLLPVTLMEMRPGVYAVGLK